MCLTIQELLNKMTEDKDFKERIVYQKTIPEKQGQYSITQYPLSENGINVLSKMGINQLYIHQAMSYDLIKQNKNILLVTPTASGKTLSFNLPILEHLLNNPDATALYIYPTKALAQDQKQKIENLNLGINVGIYDGDTTEREKKKIKGSCRIIITNPDMLHVAIMPHHRTWKSFVENLSFIVIDEMHMYRGVFGCHVSLIMRRLRRICKIYNNEPQFIGCSATISEPNKFAEKLVGVPFEVIDKNGSPKGPQHFILWNPPIVDLFNGTRRSLPEEAGMLLRLFSKNKIKTIAFMKSRQGTEKLLLKAQEDIDQNIANKIKAYRGGYLSEERREIENKLFNNELISVVATSALEVGIDIGGIDSCIIAGYPGTIASTWQQAGRAGRSLNETVVILVTANDPLDQYFATNPEIFINSPVEHPIVNPYNEYILRQQLDCLMYEIPWIEAIDKDIVGEQCHPILEDMLNNNEAFIDNGLIRRAGRNDYPSLNVNIRSASKGNWNIKNVLNTAKLGTAEEHRVFQQFHPNAIYLHQGETYEVVSLDFNKQIIWVKRSDADYYTYAKTEKDVEILKIHRQKKLKDSFVFYGDIRKKEKTIGYVKKFSDGTDETFQIDLPEQELITKAFWWTVPSNVVNKLQTKLDLDIAGSVHAIEHAAIAMLPLFAMCDRWDIGGMSYEYYPTYNTSTIFIYDGYEGGIGYAEEGYSKIELLLAKTLEIISNCKCKHGCPSCIYSPKCGNGNKPLSKTGATIILQHTL